MTKELLVYVLQSASVFALFTWILCTLSALAGHRELTNGEENALYTVWGVRDMPSLMKLEENPQNFWEETEKRLFSGDKRLLNHLEFCQWFIPIIKARLEEKLEKVDKKPWFAGGIIEEVLKKHIAEDKPYFSYILATCYANAYDYTLITVTKDLYAKEDYVTSFMECVCSSQENFETLIKSDNSDINSTLVPPCHETLRWQTIPGGSFSFFDSLVVQSKGYQLCAISPDPEEWLLFSTHAGYFQLCSGILDHDAFAHATNSLKLARHLKHHGITAQKQFDAICNPQALTAGNLITMTHQVHAWFAQFHEAPTQYAAYNSESSISLLFPGTPFLFDPGFRDVTPYFAQLPLNHNWRTTPLQKARMNDKAIQGALLAWRSLYCFQSFRFLPDQDVFQYMKVLDADLRYLTKPDLMRSKHFIPSILKDVCKSEGQLSLINTPEKLECFIKKHKALAEKAFKHLEELEPEHEHCDYVNAFLPSSVIFLSITLYADKLRQLRKNRQIVFFPAKRNNCGFFTRDCKRLLNLQPIFCEARSHSTMAL